VKRTRLSFSQLRLEPNVLLHAAETQTGLTDWGGDRFKFGLCALLDALNRSELTPRARKLIALEVMRLLSTRLLFARSVSQQPDLHEERIERPLVIVGMPRTGTTMLHCLLAEDPQFRVLSLAGATPWATNLRRADASISSARTAASWSMGVMRLAPRLRILHNVEANKPEECVHLMQYDFATDHFSLWRHIEGYRAWLRSENMLPHYQYYKLQLKLLQRLEPNRRRWLLKAPEHLVHFDSLLTVFPDAQIIHIHRDPERAVPSLCSLVSTYRRIIDPEFDGRRLGDEFVNSWPQVLDKARRLRYERRRPVVDVLYADLVNDPINTVRDIYERLGDRFAPELETGLAAWVNTHPQHAHGVHTYELAEFGLSVRAVRDAFADYCRWYEVPREDY
jgi:hypothetical protein